MKEITSNKELEDYLQDGDVVVIDIYADWCGPCKYLEPKLEEIEKEYKDIRFCKVNIKTELKKVVGIPTLEFWKKNRNTGEMNLVNKITGSNVENIKETLNKIKNDENISMNKKQNMYMQSSRLDLYRTFRKL